MNDTSDLRERTRRAVRSELLTVALDLFLRQGFEATTVDQISDAAGLSRRSFFRYFATKDELIGEALAESGARIARAVESRPRAEPPWVALRRALDPMVSHMMSDERALPMTRMMLEGVARRATHEHKQTRWRAAVSRALATRLPEIDDRRELHADALTGSALACLHAAEVAWVDGNDQSALSDLVDQAMSAVAPIR